MFALTKLATRVLFAFARDEDGLMKAERTLLTGTFVMVAITVLLLLGVDILGWFGVEPPMEEEAA
ncbi:MAG: hypothetical protein P8Q36_11160 [Alphaproteobacteria bacterium]|jgi:hypothetical protein|nr:hypothetical protein [Rhodospirillaceae bacterium]MBT6511162.1 hypothetical protein [Rhodospirillaceae bacterium]MBT7614185.1 hypothetical protein [Rhodospirillaceae bacterium]MDG2481408.1 hypothetical protein [Alphaproteobacteria bacterium]